jgi:TetR/AcrR family transcriptional regulator
MRKRKRDAEHSRDVILDAAERLFANRGYDGTSLQMVGAAAGVSRATPAYFFGSKEGLYRAVFDRAYTRVDATLREAYARLEGTETRAAITTILTAYLDLPAQFIHLFNREAVRGGTAIQDLEPRLSQIRSSLERLEAITGSRLKRVRADFLLISLVALAWYPTAHASTTLRALDLDIDDPTFRAEYTRFVTDLLLTGLAGTSVF